MLTVNNLTGKTNNIEMPIGFIDPNPLRKKMLRNIRKKKSGLFQAIVIYKRQKYYLGSFSSEAEAITAYDLKKAELLTVEKERRLSIPIKRNNDNIAIIELSNKKKEIVAECLVDDDVYYLLNASKWSLNPDGYAQSVLGGQLVRMHRALMNAFPGQLVDHINNNRLDNRVANLRFATPTENVHNQTKQAGTSSKYRGVCASRGKFKANIIKQNKSYFLGMFEKEEDAAEAYNKKATELYGEHAKLNIIR